MRVPPLVVTTTLMLIGLVISDHYLPQAKAEGRVYHRLSDAEFRLMRKEVEAFAEGLVVTSKDESERYFVLQANGQPVMLVDNSYSELAVMVAGDLGQLAPELRDLNRQWRVKTQPDWERRR